MTTSYTMKLDAINLNPSKKYTSLITVDYKNEHLTFANIHVDVL